MLVSLESSKVYKSYRGECREIIKFVKEKINYELLDNEKVLNLKIVIKEYENFKEELKEHLRISTEEMEKNVRVNIKTDSRSLKEFLEYESKLMSENYKYINYNEENSDNDQFSISNNDNLDLKENDKDINNSTNTNTNTNTLSNQSNKHKEIFTNINKDYIKFLTSIVKMYKLDTNEEEHNVKDDKHKKIQPKQTEDLNQFQNNSMTIRKRLIQSEPKNDNLYKKRIMDNLNMFSRDKIKLSVDTSREIDFNDKDLKENLFLRHSEPKIITSSKPQFFRNLNSDVSLN